MLDLFLDWLKVTISSLQLAWLEVENTEYIYIYPTFNQQKNIYKRQHKDYCEIRLYNVVICMTSFGITVDQN